jgi:hypothetical protein
MKYVISCLVLMSSCVQFPSAFAADLSCECPKLACDACSVEKGITFFTDKCGPADSKLKSCARPTCLPILEATKACPVPPVADGTPREPIVLRSPADVVVEEVQGGDERMVAGKVKVLQGSVSIVRADGKKEIVAKEGNIYEGDRVETGKETGAVVNFKGGNKMHVSPDTQVEVKEFSAPGAPDSRKALMNLIKGKIRNQVEQKYNGKTSYFKVSTRGAVAGVRGTDFVVSHSEDGKLETNVETLHGKVILGNMNESDYREVAKGEGATFSAPLGASDAELVAHGKLSDVYKIPPERMADIDRDSRMDIARRKTASDEPICEKPKGRLNQCLWKCEGNPEGSRTCRTDLPQVKCTRTRCNANGHWAEETRLPASHHDNCPAAGQLIKNCDY